jgi:hypothetical protein
MRKQAFIHDPLGEPYNETRTDCEAEIGGNNLQNLFISNVIKPIICLAVRSFKNYEHTMCKVFRLYTTNTKTDYLYLADTFVPSIIPSLKIK